MAALIFTGRGGAGSWTVRGEQLGQACGAEVVTKATAKTLKAHDVAVVVKRVPQELLKALRESGIPWVYDVVDFYPQPLCSTWDKPYSIAWVKGQLLRLRPHGVIWPNQRMRDDCEVGVPSVVIPHHHRPGIEPNPIRERVRKVGYEGSARFLCEWEPILDSECKRRGWEFVVNPGSLSELDIVVAVRGQEHNGYPQSHWKSNVKLANAQGSGTPIICASECGYRETASGGEEWADDVGELQSAFDRLTDYEYRKEASRKLLTGAISVESCAKTLTGFLDESILHRH